MDGTQLKNIRAWLTGYARRHSTDDGEFHHCLALKLAHSIRVAADCRDIALELEWDENKVRTAEAVGLLHDAARFPQFAQYRTFLDSESFDHGEKGHEIVRESGVLDGLLEPEKAAILDAIRYHNRREIPRDLAPSSMPLARIIRDADKLDIIKVVNETIRNKTYEEHPEILLNISMEKSVTPALVNQVRKYRIGSYENVHTIGDINLMRMVWVYNMNYLPALRRMRERDLIDDLVATIPATPEVVAITREVKRYMTEKFAEGRPCLL